MRPHLRLLLSCAAVAAVLLFGWQATAQAATRLTHAQAVKMLKDAGLSVWSSGNCSDRNNPNCTSFAGIRKSSIDGVITLKKASGCPVNVTGGTETGHGYGKYSHWEGWKIDISRHGCVDAYIRRHFRYTGYVGGWGHQYKAPSGNVYTDEGDHWDILYYSCGGCEDPRPTPSPSPSLPTSPSPSPSSPPASSPPVTEPPVDPVGLPTPTTSPSPAASAEVLPTIPGPAQSATPEPVAPAGSASPVRGTPLSGSPSSQDP